MGRNLNRKKTIVVHCWCWQTYSISSANSIQWKTKQVLESCASQTSLALMLSRSTAAAVTTNSTTCRMLERDVYVPSCLRPSFAITGSEAGWRTPTANERWVHRRRKRNFNEEFSSLYGQTGRPVNDESEANCFQTRQKGGKQTNEMNR